MKKVFHIFKIQKEERWLALIIFALLTILNGLVIAKYNAPFTQITNDYYKNFIRHFCISGFDPLTYWVLSDWSAAYNVYRHPLLAFYMYVPYLINMGLMKLTGYNCALYIAVIIQMFCAFYSMVFLYRIFREVIELGKWASHALTLLFFSFGYVMVSAIVPDHFVISMLLLILALYVSGRRMKNHHDFKIWQSVLYFLLTAGTSLNNGLKTYLAALFTNGRKFFSIKYFLIGVILPAALMWAFARWEYRTFVWPKEMARHEAKMKKNKEATAKIYQQYRDSTGVKDSAKVEAAVRKIIKDKAHAKYVRDHKQIWNKNTGKPIAKGEFMNWTDKTTSRSQTLVENFFGESIMLHQQNLLGDVLRNRPVIVKYQSAVNYVVEACIIVLFLLGILAGRNSKFLWLTLTFFLMDAALHIGLGFGINEVYIMTAHYMYALPIAIAFLALKAKGKNLKWAFRGLMLAITLYLWISNGYLLAGYMLG